MLPEESNLSIAGRNYVLQLLQWQLGLHTCYCSCSSDRNCFGSVSFGLPEDQQTWWAKGSFRIWKVAVAVVVVVVKTVSSYRNIVRRTLASRSRVRVGMPWQQLTGGRERFPPDFRWTGVRYYLNGPLRFP